MTNNPVQLQVNFLRSAVATPFKIVRFQALQVLGGTEQDYCVLEGEMYPAHFQQKVWEKRNKEQQCEGLAYILNRLFTLQIAGQPWASQCPDERRLILLEMCQKAGPTLIEHGWSSTDVMEWLCEIKELSTPA